MGDGACIGAPYRRRLRAARKARVHSHVTLQTLTLALSRFAVEGTQAERSLSIAPSTAKRERVGVRVSGAVSSARRHRLSAGLLPGVDAALDVAGAADAGALGRLHRHGRAL